MKYITNSTAIVLFLNNGKTIRIEKTDDKYARILKTFNLPSEEQEEAVETIVNEKSPSIQNITYDGFELSNDSVFYDGEELPKTLVDKILSIIRDGLPLDHFVKFWKRLRLNPSSNSVDQLINFLSYKELPITEDGHFLAYKGVSNDKFSIRGNLKTKIVKGTADQDGKIYNGVGEIIEVLRRDVDDNRLNGCSHGLHVGSLDYASSWGPVVVVVKVDPADVVSVPSDSNFQKCRVCKYEVVSSFVSEIKVSVVDERGDDVYSHSSKRKAFVERVNSYTKKKSSEGLTEVTIRQIQNSFSPEWPSKEQIYDALQDLQLIWNNDIVHL